jgi:hypothetical protein
MRQFDMYEDREHRVGAEPYKAAAQPNMVSVMTGSSSRNGFAGTADNLPMAMRAGAQDALALPSRMNDRLHYRDGTVKHVNSAVVHHDPFYYSDEQAITNQIQAGY